MTNTNKIMKYTALTTFSLFQICVHYRDLSGEGVSDEKLPITEYYTILHTD